MEVLAISNDVGMAEILRVRLGGGLGSGRDGGGFCVAADSSEARLELLPGPILPTLPIVAKLVLVCGLLSLLLEELL